MQRIQILALQLVKVHFLESFLFVEVHHGLVRKILLLNQVPVLQVALDQVTFLHLHLDEVGVVAVEPASLHGSEHFLLAVLPLLLLCGQIDGFVAELGLLHLQIHVQIVVVVLYSLVLTETVADFVEKLRAVLLPLQNNFTLLLTVHPIYLAFPLASDVLELFLLDDRTARSNYLFLDIVVLMKVLYHHIFVFLVFLLCYHFLLLHQSKLLLKRLVFLQLGISGHGLDPLLLSHALCQKVVVPLLEHELLLMLKSSDSFSLRETREQLHFLPFATTHHLQSLELIHPIQFFSTKLVHSTPNISSQTACLLVLLVPLPDVLPLKVVIHVLKLLLVVQDLSPGIEH